MKKLLLILTALLFVAVTNLYATPIAGVVDTSVSGSDMAGMLVTVEYADGKSHKKKWKAESGDKGLAIQNGQGWSLEFDGPNTWYSNNLDDEVDQYGRDAYWEFYSKR